jgi:hypothetical protein
MNVPGCDIAEIDTLGGQSHEELHAEAGLAIACLVALDGLLADAQQIGCIALR